MVMTQAITNCGIGIASLEYPKQHESFNKPMGIISKTEI
jgi:hypothetical protein